ncbi:MAG: O-antigen ligase family protein [Chitinophagales bacterium]|nr:O-antigen ligase family protein [Chitinophagales bacterium]
MLQTETQILQNKIQQHTNSIFVVLSVFCLFIFGLSIYFDKLYFVVMPIALLFVVFASIEYKLIYFLLLFCLPLSQEIEIGSFGFDLPSDALLILLSFLSIFIVLIHYKERTLQLLKQPIAILIILHFIWTIISIIQSTNILVSIKFSVAKFWYITVFFLLTYLIVQQVKQLKLVLWLLILPTLLTVIIIFIEHASLGFSFEGINTAVIPIYRNHVNYAVFLVMILPFIFLMKQWYQQGSIQKLLLNFTIVLFVFAIYFSYTRGAWLALVAIAVYYFVVKYKLTKWILILSAITSSIFIIYILKDYKYLKYAPNYETTIYHEDLNDHLNSTFEMEDMSTVERFYRWLAATKMIKENPIYGVGAGNFAANYKPYTVRAYQTYISDNEEKSTVHNYFLLLITEQGIPACIIFILLIIAILLFAEKSYHNNTTNKNIIMAIVLSIVAFLINNTLSDLVEANKVGSLFWINLALLLGFGNKSLQQTDI